MPGLSSGGARGRTSRQRGSATYIETRNAAISRALVPVAAGADVVAAESIASDALVVVHLVRIEAPDTAGIIEYVHT